MDGVDLAWCEFSEDHSKWKFRIRVAETLPYPAPLQKKLEQACTWNREKIRELDLIPAMISTIKFREVLWYQIETSHFTLYQLLRRGVDEKEPRLDDYLATLETKGKYTRLFLAPGHPAFK